MNTSALFQTFSCLSVPLVAASSRYCDITESPSLYVATEGIIYSYTITVKPESEEWVLNHVDTIIKSDTLNHF